jgi:hypothetical protein
MVNSLIAQQFGLWDWRIKPDRESRIGASNPTSMPFSARSDQVGCKIIVEPRFDGMLAGAILFPTQRDCSFKRYGGTDSLLERDVGSGLTESD